MPHPHCSLPQRSRPFGRPDGSFRAVLRGAARSTARILAFPVLALALAALSGASGPPREAPYTPSVRANGADGAARAGSGEPAPRLWLVDGYNVLHAGLLSGRERGGWWRRASREALLERAAGFDDPAAELWVVFDGRRPEGDRREAAERPRVAFAPSADAWLLAQVRAAAEPARVAVVTGDRKLAGRARHRGARVVRPREFLARCGAGPAAPAGEGPQAERS